MAVSLGGRKPGIVIYYAYPVITDKNRSPLVEKGSC